MAKLTNDELLDAFKEMTLIELSEFVKQFEETFGVTAAAPVAVAAAARRPLVGGEEAAGRGGRTRSTSSSRSAGDKKIQVIKEVRALTVRASA
jgi:large subunit ribosomal protein L7/L12